MKKKLVLKKETVVMLDAGMTNVRGGADDGIRLSADNLCPTVITTVTMCCDSARCEQTTSQRLCLTVISKPNVCVESRDICIA